MKEKERSRRRRHSSDNDSSSSDNSNSSDDPILLLTPTPLKYRKIAGGLLKRDFNVPESPRMQLLDSKLIYDRPPPSVSSIGDSTPEVGGNGNYYNNEVFSSPNTSVEPFVQKNEEAEQEDPPGYSFTPIDMDSTTTYDDYEHDNNDIYDNDDDRANTPVALSKPDKLALLRQSVDRIKNKQNNRRSSLFISNRKWTPIHWSKLKHLVLPLGITDKSKLPALPNYVLDQFPQFPEKEVRGRALAVIRTHPNSTTYGNS